MPKADASVSETPTFTDALQALQDVLDRFKSSQLPLEEALTLFEEGVGYVKHCQAVLNQAQGQVSTLSEALAASTAAESGERDASA